ncbi:MAG: hypothetical protein IIU58_02270, partial [Clostridia bacterium]|nr:hypothetical protein [Clostridia bacterium]
TMTEVFLKLINMSITASWIVLAVILLRFLLKKAPRGIICALWALVAIRLVCPFSVESMLSLIPSAETVPEEIVYAREPVIDSGVPIINQTVNPIITSTFAPPDTLTSVNPIQVFLAVAANLWILGMIAMVLYAAISYLRLRKKIAEAVEAEQGVWLCDHVDTPFILGILRPRIILPSAMEEKDREYVLAHERAHLRRRDHFWKPLGFALLTVYWFNPVLWVAYILLCRDIELACDERVIREMGTQEKKAYTTALLNCSVPRRMIAACPLAFGEVGVKQRIRNALHYKKPALWIIAVAVVASIVFAVCFLTDPKEELPEVYGHSYRVSEVVYGAPYLSFMYIPDHNTPYFSVTEDMHLLSKEQLQPGAEWTRLGKLEDFTLTKADFDDLFFAEYSFRDDTPKKLRRENAYAWRLDKEDPYYLLQQENGDLYIAYGTREMHWMFKLEADETVGADERADIPDLSHETTVAYAGYIRNYAIITGALNRDKMMESSIHHLPIYKFESEAELAKFESDFADDIANRAHGEVPCFDVVARQYDAEFFEEKTLFIVYVQASSGSCRYDVGSVVWGANSGSLTIHAEVTRSPATEDMAGWFL